MKPLFRLRSISLLTALFTSSLAYGSEWKLVVDAGYLVYEIDQETISKEKSIVTFWSRSTVHHGEVYFAKYAPNETPYKTAILHHRIDCSKRIHSILSGTHYGDTGQSMNSFSEPSPEINIIPDSVAEHYLKFVCAKPRQKR